MNRFYQRPLPGLKPAIFFGVFYLYTWLVIEPKLIYYSFGKTNPYYPFLLDGGFLLEFLTTISGPTACLAGFLSQCFYYSWLGAAILTAIGWLFWLFFEKIFAATQARSFWWVSYVFPVLLLMMYTAYDHQFLGVLSLLTVLGAFVLYIKADIRRNIPAGLLFLTEFALLYYIAGGAVIQFGLLVGLYELFIRGRKLLAGGIFILPVAYYIWVRFFDVPSIHSLLLLTQPRKTSGSIMDFLPFLVLLGIAIHKNKHVFRSETAQKIFAGADRFSGGMLKTGRDAIVQRLHSERYDSVKRLLSRFHAGLILRTALPFVLIGLAFCVSYRGVAKIVLETGYYSDEGQWHKVLKCARSYPRSRYDIFCNHDVNRALYHTGQLGDKMFSYRQAPTSLLLSYESSLTDLRIWAKLSRKVNVFLDLGHLGDAERFASEILESTNQCPYTLKKLALIYLAQRRYETARVYLNTLSRDIIHGRFARQILRCLEEDPDLAAYEPVQYLRSVAIETDNVGEYKPDDFFSHALQKSPPNRMAFEYMMAFRLAMGQIEKFVENIHRLKDFSFERLPRHYEEALIIYAVMSQRSNKPFNLSDFSIDPETIRRFNEFDEDAGALYNMGYDKESVKRSLAKDYGDSYMYYLNFEFQRGEK